MRGPLIGTITERASTATSSARTPARYAVYRALAVAAGALDRDHQPDLTNTAPTEPIGPHPQWFDPERIVSLDPYGAMVGEVFADRARPRATTSARPSPSPRRTSTCPRSAEAIAAGRLQAGRQGAARHGLRRGHQGRASSRCGTCRASPSASACTRPSCAARCSRRPAACSRSWSRAATSRCSCRRSAARPSTCSATGATRRPDVAAHRARARRVQRLGRVRLRHLHLPALPDPRASRSASGRRSRRRRASSSTSARRAARSAR